MSYISMMQLRGIRSFSPNNDENIEFYSPLTMIVGANGCGKTTIIESLKFACTGSLPPNTKSGQSMINDPGMTDSAEVKAHIKLRFKNRNNYTCVVTRSLQVTKRRNKLEYKALDAALSTLDLQGHKSSASMKCSEVDRIIPENLGVSAAILENVIFVHQEDSNWPMQEGMVLKKKFDDIFESTRYTKALEALSKTKKDYVSKSKDLKAELAEFGAHMTTVLSHKKELLTCQQSQDDIQGTIDSLADRIKSHEVKRAKAQGLVDKAREQMEDLQKAQWQVGEAERRVQEKDSNLEQKLDAGDDELQRMINNFEAAMASKQQELRVHKSQVDNIQSQIGRLREEVNRLNAKKGQVELLQEQVRTAKEQQMQMARSLGRKYTSAPSAGTEFNPRTMKDYQAFLYQEKDRIQQEMVDSMKSVRLQLQDSETSFQRLRVQLQEVEIELKMKSEEDSHVLSEWDAKRIEASRLSSNRAAVQRAQQEYDSVKQTHDDFFDQFNAKSAELKKSMKEVSDQLHSLQDDINNDAQMIQEMSLHRNEIANLDATANHIAADQATMQSDLNAIFSLHKDILSSAPPSNSSALQASIDSISRKVSEFDQAYQMSKQESANLRSSLSAKEALITQCNTQKTALQAKEQESVQLVQEMRALIPPLNDLRGGRILNGINFDHLPMDISPSDLLDAAKQTEEESRELLTIAKSGKVYLRRIKKLRQQNPNACPCCGQGMNESVKAGFDAKVQTLFALGDEQQFGTVEENKEVADAVHAIYDKLQRIYNRYIPLQNVGHENMSLDMSLAELLKDKLSLQSQLQTVEQQAKEFEDSFNKYSKLYRALQDLVTRWRGVEQREEELQERRRRQSQSLLGDMSNISLDKLEALQRERVEKKDQLQQQKEKLAGEEAALVKRSYQIKNSLSEASQAITRAQLDNKRAEEIDTQINKLHERHQELDVRKKVLMNDRDRLSREIADVQMQVNAKKAEVQRMESKFNDRISACQQDLESFSKALKSIEDLELNVQNSNWEAVEKSLADTLGGIQQKEQEIKVINPKIQTIQQEIASQEHTKRNIAANLDLRMSIIELQSLREDLKLKEVQSGGNMEQIRRTEQEANQLSKEIQALASERDTLKGKLEVHRLREKEIKAMLNKPPYKDVEEKYRRKNIEFETTNLAVTDLDSYYTALDGALQTFHTLKIREINKIIRELWQLIYQGQDIDTIELESGVGGDPESGAVASASGSRSYNYRVVMKKGDVPLDMRGRCSAGQKVLASIVIRLALAETFCLDCGVLALDEPTTNLDEANKIGLAQALTRLIVGRAKQQNFQLICITHDEDFVRTMRTELAMAKDFSLPEYYFRVYREEDGNSGRFFSHIERVNWDEL